MDQAYLHEVEAQCTQEAPPRCRAACPLHMDVRAFMEHMEEGRYVEARKLLERHLSLPGIFVPICDAPCEEACLRRDLGGSLAVSALERFCCARVGPQTRLLPRPPKTVSLAVLGNGLAALTAAADVARKGFPVTIFHAGAPREALYGRYPALTAPELAADMDAEWATLEKSGVRFENAVLDRALLERARTEFAAVFVDADATALAPARRDAVDAATLVWEDNCCCGGWLETSPTGARYASSSRQAGDGRRAGLTLQRMLSGSSLTAARDNEADTTRLHTPLEGVPPVARVVPQTGEAFTAAEARREAGRCLRCQCMACVRECVYLQKYKSFPRSYARQMYNNASIVMGQHLANNLINGCALCGQCTEICPENFRMAELCLHVRQDMVRREYMPPSAHEFALEDMAQAVACAVRVGVEGASPARYALFPGCQLAASRGGQVLALYRHLRQAFAAEGGMALWITCCGVPAHWAGNQKLFTEHAAALRSQWENMGKPTLVAACASCLLALREALPEIPCESLWSVLDARPLPEHAGNSPLLREKLSIHDPCSARNDAEWQRAVRSLARKSGVDIAEPRNSGSRTPCCGYGGLVWNAQPELARAMTTDRAGQLPYPALCSCIMCRDRLADEGKESLHILDILFSPAAWSTEDATTAALAMQGVAAGNAQDAIQGVAEGGGLDAEGLPLPDGLWRRGPGLSARREGRMALRRAVLRAYAGQDAPAPQDFPLHIDAALLARMEAAHILRQDAEAAVQGIARTGRCFLEQDSGHLVGSWRPRNVTFWVEFSQCGEGYMLHDAWCHRMRVPGATQPDEGENA